MRAIAGRSFTLGELAKLLGVRFKGDPQIVIRGIDTLENAGPDELSFLVEKRYEKALADCRASALIVGPLHEHLTLPLLIAERPQLVLAGASKLLFEAPPPPAGIHPRAFVAEDTMLAEGVFVGPLAHIGSGCRVGKSCVLSAGAHLGNRVILGDGCVIHPNAVILDDCILGNRVVVHSGTVIGGDGFGYAQDEKNRHVKIPQVGIVEIEDDVEIGANCAIDRATFGKTLIKQGAKIDNLVQIGHNVVIGECAVLVSQVGVSGSSRIGRYAVLAGQVGIVDHVEIGDGARVGAKSGVSNSVKARQDVSGIPAVPHREWLRTQGHIRRLPDMKTEIRGLGDRVRRLEESLGSGEKHEPDGDR